MAQYSQSAAQGLRKTFDQFDSLTFKTASKRGFESGGEASF